MTRVTLKIQGLSSGFPPEYLRKFRYASSAEFDADLAKEVAAYQVRSGTVPPDLTDLLSALRRRIAPAAPTPP